MTKKILITGASGFIGRSLYEHFSNVYFSPLERNVIATTRQDLDLLDSDSVYKFLKQNKFDAVIHSATYDAAPRFAKKDSQLVLEKNLRMFFNIYSARAHFGKMIYFGSGAEAGRENWIPKMTEDYIEKKIPPDQYGFSKHIMNEVAGQSTNIYNLRLFGVFGKFDDWRYRFISNVCCKAALDMPIIINKNVRFDYLDMQDLANITERFIEKTTNRQSYNVCSGNVYDYRTIAEKIREISGKDLEIIIKEGGESPEYSGNPANILTEFESLSITPLDISLKRLYNWYSQCKTNIHPSQFEY